VSQAAALTVYTDSYPIAYFAERIAGETAEIVFPVPPDRDPAFWRPSIAEIGEFQAADLVLLNGAGFADWTTRTSLPPGRTVDTSRGFADRFIVTEGVTHSHGPEGEHSHTATAAFTWLDLMLAAEQARAVALALTRRLPDQAQAIEAGRNALIADLAGLDEIARALPDPAPGTVIIASHPRYQYFARAYGLEISSVQWDFRETPDAAAWAEFDALAAGGERVVMIWEAVPTPETLNALETRGVAVAVLPTLANRPPDADFLEAFATGLEQLHEALAP
jgi:zinc transport system substrate-binding protein